LGNLIARVQIKNSEEIEQKQKEMKMRKEFVRDVSELLKKRNLKYEEYFTIFLSKGEIQTDKFAQ
jgi:hypothetical protein